MMVERSPYIEKMGLLVKDLNQATQQLEEISRKPQATKQELTDLIKVLQHLNKTLDPRFWEEKKLAAEGMSASIERALAAVRLFQSTQPALGNRSGQRNVDQAIASLSSALTAALNTFDKNLRNLKDYKIGRKVEKTGESKHTS
jgi:flagellar biosynthesis GTPase FlhF